MSKSESKYFNAVQLMSEALIRLLEKTDYEFITVKQLCQTAGVNRSTFYLHYQNMDELLADSINWLNGEFLSYFNKKSINVDSSSLDNLKLVKCEYLEPYLSFVKSNKHVFQVAKKQPYVMNSFGVFNKMYNSIFEPILKRFAIPQADRPYIIAFYINGIVAVIGQWIKNDCTDSIKYISDLIINLVMSPKE